MCGIMDFARNYKEENKMIQNELKNNICSAILRTTSADSITVFGSYARDEENDDSDIDLCVITNEAKRPIEIMTDLRLALSPFLNKPLDLVVYSKEEFKSRINKGFSFENNINTEGKKIYG